MDVYCSASVTVALKSNKQIKQKHWDENQFLLLSGLSTISTNSEESPEIISTCGLTHRRQCQHMYEDTWLTPVKKLSQDKIQEAMKAAN